MLRKTLISAAVTMLVFTANAHALQIDESHPVAVTVPAKAFANQREKKIVLMNVKLSSKEKAVISNYHAVGESLNESQGMASRAVVDMHGVPVLDQGMHGTCVTFAVTAALDALLGKQDYVSQLCSLELGQYLKRDGYYPSGWNGSFAPVVLDQLFRFGVVNKDKQKAGMCANFAEYPADDQEEMGNAMSLDAQHMISEDIGSNMFWKETLHYSDRFLTGLPGDSAKKVLLQVKRALAESASGNSGVNHMVVVGMLLPSVKPGNACALDMCASYHAPNDTWAMTEDLTDEILGGHEMVITGYDDAAISVDHTGKKHKGLLFLRNSWGTNVGDHGDFYMTYDFFQKYVLEVTQITSVSDDNPV